MKPAIVVDDTLESTLIHWLVLEKQCPLDVVTRAPCSIGLVREPYYEDGDVLLYDQATLVQFLQERYPGEQLLPSDPIARAQIRQACTLVSEPDVNMIDQIEEILNADAMYMAGNDFTLLDIYVGTWLYGYVSQNNEIGAKVYSYWRRISSRAAFRIATL